MSGQSEAVEALIAAGAIVDESRSDDLTTPLYAAAQQGHFDVVSSLLAAGASVHKAKRGIHSTPLYVAVKNRHHKVADLLIDAGADIFGEECCSSAISLALCALSSC